MRSVGGMGETGSMVEGVDRETIRLEPCREAVVFVPVDNRR